MPIVENTKHRPPLKVTADLSGLGRIGFDSLLRPLMFLMSPLPALWRIHDERLGQ